MTDSYIRLNKIEFTGPVKMAAVDFVSGVNVICGASDTGKSFVAETIDFMLGGKSLKEIPERIEYEKICLSLTTTENEQWQLKRAIAGGDFLLLNMQVADESEEIKLGQKHSHNRGDNLSGFLLDKIGLLGKRIAKSVKKGTTISLSFRNLARLIIVQELEIQQKGSPFWGGQYTQKNSELATVKLMLTGVDDSALISTSTAIEADNTNQIGLIDEMLSELENEIADLGQEEGELTDQLSRLENSIYIRRKNLSIVQRSLDDRITSRQKVFTELTATKERLDEINEHLKRFELLSKHYEVDKERLKSIQESGSMFAHVTKVQCPLCGAEPDDQHTGESCDGDVEAVVQAASAELDKIERLTIELMGTVGDLNKEAKKLLKRLTAKTDEYKQLDLEIQETISPQVSEVQGEFSELIEKRAGVQKTFDIYERIRKLEERKQSLIDEENGPSAKKNIATSLPDSVSHKLSLKISTILRAWNFPGECHVHFDKESSDFVIDGKPRGSSGKGLRAITHAAVTLALFEFCQEHSLPHPGFVVLDSPLLAYYEAEGDEEKRLQGTDLKNRFYEYLIQHHGNESQVIIIENQHPPVEVEGDLAMTVFTKNPDEGRYGLL